MGALLDDLIDRYDTGAVVSVDAYMPDNSGTILRWLLSIDGSEVEDVDVRTVPQEDGSTQVLGVRGEDQLELGRWDWRHPDGHRLLTTLGGLKRHGR